MLSAVFLATCTSWSTNSPLGPILLLEAVFDGGFSIVEELLLTEGSDMSKGSTGGKPPVVSPSSTSISLIFASPGYLT